MDSSGSFADIADVLREDPDFIDRTPPENRWVPDPDGHGIQSERFGWTRTVVALGPSKNPLFARTVTGESEHINGSAWYVHDGAYYFGLAEQGRHFALKPDRTVSMEPIVFAQPVMGFSLPLPKRGKQVQQLVEAGEAAAVREALEELGVRDVINIELILHHYVNPTFVQTPTPLFSLEVDPSTLTGEGDQSEFIKKVTFVDAREIDRRLRHVDEHGRRGWFEDVCYNAAPFRIAFDAWARHVGILKIG